MKRSGNKPQDSAGSEGFSLVELVVAIGIFSVVMTIAFGSFVSLLDTQRQMQALKSVSGNLNSSVESMTRDIRFGSYYYCNAEGDSWKDERDYNVTGGDDGDYKEAQECSSLALTFHREKVGEDQKKRIRYYLEGAGTEDDPGQIMKQVNDLQDENGEFEERSVTAPEVNIKELRFFVDRQTEGGPALVVLEVDGEVVMPGREQADFSLQTSNSQRNPQEN